MEISPRMTLARAPGHSVFNGESWPGINDFYSYHVDLQNADNFIRVVVDTQGPTGNDGATYGAVYDASSYGGNRNVQKLIFKKSAGSGQTRFMSVGNTLYMGNGVDLVEYLSPFFVWQENYQFPTGVTIAVQDTNKVDQIMLNLGWATVCTNVTISSGTITLVLGTTEGISQGDVITMYGMTQSYLNSVPLVVGTISGSTITASFEAPDLVSTAEAGFITDNNITGESNSGSEPTWVFTWQALAIDGTLLWMYVGPAVRPWGIPAPTVEPTTTNQSSTEVNSALTWAENTYYLPAPYIYVASNSTIQQLTQAGTTGAGTPSWSATPSTQITDGTAKWTCSGPSARQTNYAYTVGDVIYEAWSVTSTYTTYQPPTVPAGYPPGYTKPNPVTTTVITYYACLFQCTTAGTSSSLSDNAIWGAVSPGGSNVQNPSSTGSTITESTGVVWTNIGAAVSRLHGTGTLAPQPGTSSAVLGNIGDSQLVAITNYVVDPLGNSQLCTQAGESSALSTDFSWVDTANGSTTDGTAPTGPVIWLNQGNSASVGGTGSNAQPWKYTYAYMDIATGSVGPAYTPLSVGICKANNSFIQVSGSYTNLSSVGAIIIFRTIVGGDTPYFIASIPNNGTTSTWIYNDLSGDQGAIGSTQNLSLPADLVSYNAPPPSGFVPVAFHLNSIWGFVKETLYYGAGGDVVDMQGGFESFPAVNYINFQSDGVVGWSTSNGLYLFLVDSLQLVAGAAAPFGVSKIADIGMLSPNCFSLNGQCPYLLTADHQLIGIDPSAGISVDGQPIADLLMKFDPSASYVTYYVNGTDQRLIVGDGTGSYYTMTSSIAPENPVPVWSTQRQIAAGISAIKSVETSPGVYQMLVGPKKGTTGPILYRDVKATDDVGAVYDSWCIVGSNVLCHPGQLAEIGFIHCEALRVGVTPQISVLLNEIYGYPGCPEFLDLGKYEKDPPKLPESGSLFSNRYYLVQTGKPSWCRNMMIKISFGKTSTANELLSMTIFGALHAEKTEGGR